MRKQLLLIAIVLVGVQAMAQRDVSLPEYHFNPLSYNPAYAGTTGNLSLATSYIRQWAGIEGSPKTIYINGHSPINYKNLSVGGNVKYNKVGESSFTTITVDAAYYIQLNERDDRISFGLRGGMDFLSFNYGNLHGSGGTAATDSQAKNESKTKGNVGAGVYYYTKDYFAGVSALSLANDLIDPRYNIYGGYLYDINENITLRPTAMLKIAGETVFDIEVAAHIYNRAWAGIGYETNKNIRFYALFNVIPELNIGYNYTYVSGDIGTYTGGTHQFTLTYDFIKKTTD